MLIAFNGKFGGGRMIMSPSSLINDGKFEVYTANYVFSTAKLINCFEQAKRGGEHYYEPEGTILSIKKLRL